MEWEGAQGANPIVGEEPKIEIAGRLRAAAIWSGPESLEIRSLQ